MSTDHANHVWADQQTHLMWQDTWKAMETTVDMGLVKSIGISNFSSKKTDDWFGDARIQPAINQVSIAAADTAMRGRSSHSRCAANSSAAAKP